MSLNMKYHFVLCVPRDFFHIHLRSSNRGWGRGGGGDEGVGGREFFACCLPRFIAHEIFFR